MLILFGIELVLILTVVYMTHKASIIQESDYQKRTLLKLGIKPIEEEDFSTENVSAHIFMKPLPNVRHHPDSRIKEVVNISKSNSDLLVELLVLTDEEKKELRIK